MHRVTTLVHQLLLLTIMETKGQPIVINMATQSAHQRLQLITMEIDAPNSEATIQTPPFGHGK